MIDVSALALAAGFVNAPPGSHSSRTMALVELQQLLQSRPAQAAYDQYREAVVDENVLGKATTAGRTRTFRQLRELYALDPDVLIFRALRDLWDDDPDAQPLLALLCASAREPLLRATADTLLVTPPGYAVTARQLTEAIDVAYPGRYSPGVSDRIGRNLASSWTQSGHLQGRARKVRVRAACRPPAVSYALLLGHLCGVHGDALFRTLWARLLDAPDSTLREQATRASRRGWIDYRAAGDVTEVSFGHLLRALPEMRAT